MGDTKQVCPVDCGCAGCACVRCGSNDFETMEDKEVVMEEVLKPLFDFCRCTECSEEWIVYK